MVSVKIPSRVSLCPVNARKKKTKKNFIRSYTVSYTVYNYKKDALVLCSYCVV